MAFEIRDAAEEALGTVRNPKYKVYDLNGATPPNITAVAYKLVQSGTGTAVIDTTGTYNNSDTDAAGNTIKTVTLALDLTGTDITAGHYVLWWRVTFADSQTIDFRHPYKIRDYEEVY